MGREGAREGRGGGGGRRKGGGGGECPPRFLHLLTLLKH